MKKSMCFLMIAIICGMQWIGVGETVQKTLPSGAKVDAVLTGNFPTNLSVYNFKEKQLKEDEIEKIIVPNKGQEDYLVFSDPDYLSGVLGGDVMYINKKFSYSIEYMLTIYAPLFPSVKVDRYANCAFMDKETAIQKIIADTKLIIDPKLDVRCREIRGFHKEDVKKIWKAFDKSQDKKNNFFFNYETEESFFFEIDEQENEAYMAYFTLMLNDIPFISTSDTYNYPGTIPLGNTVFKYLVPDLDVILSPSGYRRYFLVYNMTLLDEKNASLLPLDEILDIYDAYVYNEGDYRYPKTIRNIYLQYIPTHIDWKKGQGEIRPYYCLTEEKTLSTWDSTDDLSACAYRFDAITGELLQDELLQDE